jgi:hypothetical protein
MLRKHICSIAYPPFLDKTPKRDILGPSLKKYFMGYPLFFEHICPLCGKLLEETVYKQGEDFIIPFFCCKKKMPVILRETNPRSFSLTGKDEHSQASSIAPASDTS